MLQRSTHFLAAIVLFALAITGPSAAQQETETEKQRPCTSPEAREFDFWVGEWDLSWDENGKGKNTVQLVLSDCVVHEQFDGTPTMPLRGWSVSTFDQKSGKWKQTWVDNQGGYLDFVGEYRDGRMVLSREATINGKKGLQRMVWQDIQKNQIEWYWDRSFDGGESWETVWHIHYHRKQ